ncbi:hypothetical protein V6N12_003087 [Hibiscus sabdariffa]|uniref:Uncharacterized protein n=1 Tax=Hibiscus sabdariffa TaxID=183260 RepID=A0ABR2EBB3_9ROSI
MIEETKVFHNSLIRFLCFQFPDAARFFSTPPNTAPPLANSVVNPSEEAGQTEPVNLSKEDIFDWQTLVIPPTTTPPAHTDNATDPSPARKRKKPAGRTIQADTPLTLQTTLVLLLTSMYLPQISRDGDTSMSSAVTVKMMAAQNLPHPNRCKGTVLRSASHGVEKFLHFKEDMTQGFCETMWLPATGSRQILLQV